jgi:hypothetical protein
VGCEGVGAKGQTLEEMVWYDSTFVVVVDQLRQYKQQLAAKTRVKILFLLIFNVCWYHWMNYKIEIKNNDIGNCFVIRFFSKISVVLL